MITEALYIANHLIKQSKCLEEGILFKNLMDIENLIL